MNALVPDSGRTLRVAHLIHGLDVGGLEQLVVRLAAAGRQFGVESTVLALGDDGPVRELLAKEQIPLVWLGGIPGLTKAAIQRIAQECTAFEADVIHGHDVGPWVNGVAARALVPRMAAMATVHQLQPLGGKMGVLSTVAAGFSAALVACGHAVHRNLARLGRLVPLHVIENGIPIESSTAWPREKSREELGLPQDAFVVGYLGRLHHEKGCDLLLKAFQSAFADDAEVHLVLIGSGSEEAALRAEVKPAVSRRIHFAGTKLDGARLLSAFDLYVQPSRREGRSLSLLEAMAAGLPTVAHDLPELREIHTDEQTALLTPANDVESLARALSRLRREPLLRSRLGEGARRAVRGHSLEAMAESYCQLYRDVVTRAS